MRPGLAPARPRLRGLRPSRPVAAPHRIAVRPDAQAHRGGAGPAVVHGSPASPFLSQKPTHTVHFCDRIGGLGSGNAQIGDDGRLAHCSISLVAETHRYGAFLRRDRRLGAQELLKSATTASPASGIAPARSSAHPPPGRSGDDGRLAHRFGSCRRHLPRWQNRTATRWEAHSAEKKTFLISE